MPLHYGVTRPQSAQTASRTAGGVSPERMQMESNAPAIVGHAFGQNFDPNTSIDSTIERETNSIVDQLLIKDSNSAAKSAKRLQKQPQLSSAAAQEQQKQKKKPVEMRTSDDVHFLFGQVLSRAINQVAGMNEDRAAASASIGLPPRPSSAVARQQQARQKNSNQSLVRPRSARHDLFVMPSQADEPGESQPSSTWQRLKAEITPISDRHIQDSAKFTIENVDSNSLFDGSSALSLGRVSARPVVPSVRSVRPVSSPSSDVQVKSTKRDNMVDDLLVEARGLLSSPKQRGSSPRSTKPKVIFSDSTKQSLDLDSTHAQNITELKRLQQQLEQQQKEEEIRKQQQYEEELRRERQKLVEEQQRMLQEQNRLKREEQERKSALERARIQREEDIRKERLEKEQALHNRLLEEAAKSFQLTRRHRLLNRYFFIWKRKSVPAVARNRDIQQILHWKKKSRCFRSWREYAYRQKSLRERERIQSQLVQEKQLEESAAKYYKTKLLSRCLVAWLCKLRLRREQQRLNSQQNQRKAQMESFLSKLQKQPNQENVAKQAVITKEEDQPSTDAMARKLLAEIDSHLAVQNENSDTELPKPSELQPIANGVATGTEGDQATAPQAKQESATPKKKATASSPQQPPKFLISMQERNNQRKERWEQLQNKYKEVEEEKQKQRLLEEQRQIEEEKARKQAIIAEKQREKEEKRQKELQKIEQKIRDENNMQIADKHCIRSTMKFYGLLPWKKLLQMLLERQQLADQLCNTNVMHTAFESLRKYVFMQRQSRAASLCARVAEMRNRQKHRRLAKSFEAWKQQIAFRSIQLQISRQRYDELLQRRYIAAWKKFTSLMREEQVLRDLRLEQVAQKHALRYAKRFYLRRWRQFVVEQKEHREKEKIGLELKQRAKSWLKEWAMRPQVADEWRLLYLDKTDKT